jgi:hypothetical protein
LLFPTLAWLAAVNQTRHSWLPRLSNLFSQSSPIFYSLATPTLLQSFPQAKNGLGKLQSPNSRLLRDSGRFSSCSALYSLGPFADSWRFSVAALPSADALRTAQRLGAKWTCVSVSRAACASILHPNVEVCRKAFKNSRFEMEYKMEIVQSQFKFIPIFIPFRRNGTKNQNRDPPSPHSSLTHAHVHLTAEIALSVLTLLAHTDQ